MRFRFKRGLEEELQTDLKTVQDTLQSGYFMLIDLFFWALLLTVFTKPVHHSIQWIIIVFFGYYIMGVCLFLLLRALFKVSFSTKKITTEREQE
ncbi:hypothetical protein [Niallia sp. Krafla_26]|uniref:hypothetical protein n=1 Tax=Niallia sp. Krafla_26 TaxID=3064703 RepID=UPI003D17F11D